MHNIVGEICSKDEKQSSPPQKFSQNADRKRWLPTAANTIVDWEMQVIIEDKQGL